MLAWLAGSPGRAASTALADFVYTIIAPYLTPANQPGEKRGEAPEAENRGRVAWPNPKSCGIRASIHDHCLAASRCFPACICTHSIVHIPVYILLPLDAIRQSKQYALVQPHRGLQISPTPSLPSPRRLTSRSRSRGPGFRQQADSQKRGKRGRGRES
ncbi:hypothetical protein GGR56DRAFT_204663 [Xylariaceae sp. FL0804]|nr:hypothetical protein GGR56DRAFT_204663 [Xylariaceae sp. FL0804]